MKNVRTIIIGSGLAGLGAAMHLKDDDYLIIEKDDHPGGLCTSKTVSGFVFDHGIHVLHSTNDYVLKRFSENGVDFNVLVRDAWIYLYHVYTRYPFQVNTYGLPSEVVAECLTGFVKAYFNTAKPDDIANYRDWLLAYFGDGIANHFLIPYCNKMWTVSPEELGVDWLNVRIPKPQLEDVIMGALSDYKKGFGPNATFRYPNHGGIGRITEQLAKTIPATQLLLNSSVTSLDFQQKRLYVHDTEYQYENLISTIPLPELTTLMGEHVPSSVLAASEALNYNSILCFNYGINREHVSDKHWIYYSENEYPFFRVSFPMNFGPAMCPSGSSSVSAEVSYSRFKGVNFETIETDVYHGLINAGVIDEDDEIVVRDTMHIKYGYVIYDHARRQNVKVIHDFMRDWGITPAGRFGQWAYLWMDGAFMSGKAAAERVNSAIGEK